MHKPLSSWKLFILAAAIAGPIGYWMFSRSGISPSQAYAVQLAESNQARAQLDPTLVAHAEQLSKVFREVAKSVKPSVVSIKSLVDRPSSPRGGARGYSVRRS